jgi:predicted DNA-binding transcriptional regulator AlpA
MKRRDQAEPEQAGERFIGIRDVQRRYGNVSHMTIERRLTSDPSFPKPIRLGHQRMWRIADLERYERDLFARSA